MFDWIDFPAWTQWLIDLLLWIPRQIFNLFMTGVEALYLAIPTPAWVSNLDINVGGLVEGLGWFMSVFQVPTVLSIVLSALLIRFMLRALPSVF